MDLLSRLLWVRQSWKEKKIDDNDKSTELGDLNVTPKKHKCMILRRSYAITDIAALVSDADESEHEPQVSNDEYEPQSQPQGYATDEGLDLDDLEPTPKKQKMVEVPIREMINANRKEQELRKAENKVSITIY